MIAWPLLASIQFLPQLGADVTVSIEENARYVSPAQSPRLSGEKIYIKSTLDDTYTYAG